MREIGSEFWDVPVGQKKNGIIPSAAQWFLSGRSALRAIIRDLKDCRTVAMPSWCCNSMVIPFVEAGMVIRFNPVYWQNGLIQEITLDSDVLFLMDYFGYTGCQVDLFGYKGVVIRDITHSVFSVIPTDADYYFGSLRKWCGVWTGGYAWSSDGHRLPEGNSGDSKYIVLREKAMQQKKRYITGQGVTDKAYLAIFEKAERVLEKVDIAPASERDVKLAQWMDVNGIRSRRRANAEVLQMAFPEQLIFSDYADNDCPMFVPILVPKGKRNELWNYLIQHNIYCPVHWPVSEYQRLDKRTKTIYDNELSLVCDQRYNSEDMNRMVEVIKAFWREV